MNTNMEDMDPRMHGNAVSVYDNSGVDDFPVLKAFQQYIDAEQAKARKRMMLICIFFSFILMLVIAVFIGLLFISSSRNQVLNDRLIEYVMRDRSSAMPQSQQPSMQPQMLPQPVRQQDAEMMRLLSDKLDSLQTAIVDDRKKDPVRKEDVKPSEDEKLRAEKLEIERLKALLAIEKERAAADREKKRQAELESYRREHYPEFYGLRPKNAESPSVSEDEQKRIDERERKKILEKRNDEANSEIEAIIGDFGTITYFDEDDEEPVRTVPANRNSQVKRENPPRANPPAEKKKDADPPSGDGASIRRGIGVSSGSTFDVPEE